MPVPDRPGPGPGFRILIPLTRHSFGNAGYFSQFLIPGFFALKNMLYFKL